MARGLDALMSMREALRNYDVEEVHVLATSAMRDAKNGPEFVAEAKRLADLDIQVIGGAHEARLIQEGIWLNHPKMPDETCLTMDIGGGAWSLWFGRATRSTGPKASTLVWRVCTC